MMRQKDLAFSLALDNSSVVRLVDGLMAQGWVETVADADRRVKRIQLNATVAALSWNGQRGAGRGAPASCAACPPKNCSAPLPPCKNWTGHERAGRGTLRRQAAKDA